MSGGPSNAIEALAQTSLAGPIKLSAIRVVKTVIFGSADYGAAWIERATEGVRDGTRARSIMSDALAQEAALKLGHKPELVERAIEAWLPRAVRKQANRESVAEKAVEFLETENLEHGDLADVSPRWIERFSSFAEDVDDDEMQMVWARILSGEIAKPGSFSITTLRVLSELDPEDAQAFEEFIPACITDNSILFSDDLREHPIFDKLLALSDAGLLTYPDANVGQIFLVDESGIYDAELRGLVLRMEANPAARAVVSTVPMTRAGREIARVLPIETSIETAEKLCGQLRSIVKTADLYRRTEEGLLHQKSLVTTVEPGVPPSSP